MRKVIAQSAKYRHCFLPILSHTDFRFYAEGTCLSPSPKEKLSVGRSCLNDDRRNSSAPQLCRSVSVISLCCCICRSEGLATNMHLHFLSRCFHAPQILCCMGMWSFLVPHFFSFLYLFVSFPNDRPKI